MSACPYCGTAIHVLAATDGKSYSYSDPNGHTPHRCVFSTTLGGVKQAEAMRFVSGTPEYKQLQGYWKKVILYLVQVHGEVSADELRRYLMDHNQQVPSGGQMGTLFKRAGLAYTRSAPSAWPPNKKRHVRYWVLPVTQQSS